jgi:Protein of unknown function (DUF3987)/CHC2 zinc finger
MTSSNYACDGIESSAFESQEIEDAWKQHAEEKAVAKPRIEFQRIRMLNPLVAYCLNAGIEIRQSGERWMGRCPIHDEQTGEAFVIYPDDRWQCFGRCSKQGDVIDLEKELHGGTLAEAARRLDLDGIPKTFSSRKQEIPFTVQRTGNIEDCPPVPMREGAFYGLAGTVVKIAVENSEACKEAILVQFLVSMGNILGRDLYINQGVYNHLNEFACLVGDSGGAKGTSWDVIRGLLELVDEDWGKHCIKPGMATGEALINSIIDSREIILKGKRNGETGLAETVTEPGVDDKRALMLETEFSRLLAVCARSGNTLSEVLRQAFDSNKHLATNAKSDHRIATHPHVSLIGHITPTELKERMNDISYSNGFGNRILWVEAYSSKSLPFGCIPDWYSEEKLITNLRDVVAWAKAEARFMRWTDGGSAAWAHWYNKRENGKGIVGALLQRDRTHVLRLAMIYAILDGKVTINEDHLEAALAVWNYCAQTVRRIFGNMKGSSVAEKIFDFVSISGDVSMREIYDHLSRNVSSKEIRIAVHLLESQALVRSFAEKSGSKMIEKVKVNR